MCCAEEITVYKWQTVSRSMPEDGNCVNSYQERSVPGAGEIIRAPSAAVSWFICDHSSSVEDPMCTEIHC